MDQLQRLNIDNVWHLAPELTLVISALVLALLDLLMPKQVSRNVVGWLSLLALAISAVFVIGDLSVVNVWNADTHTTESAKAIQLLNQSYRIDDFANLFKLLFLIATGLIVFMSLGTVRSDEIPHIGEFYYLFIPAVLGAMVMASSGDLITLYIGLELLSITSYIMVGMRKKHYLSNEASFKYVVLGGISSAISLYGMSFLYGMTGSTNLQEINSALSANSENYTALIYVAFFLLLAGFGMKIAAAPFHTWAPDVYQGAPTPVTAFLAVVSKAAGFAILFRVFYTLFAINRIVTTPIHADIFMAISVLAAIAMIIGNALALKQKNMKRLLAYSGIANAGYLLVPIGANFSLFHYSNFSEFLFYLIAYMVMNIGTIAMLMMVSRKTHNEEISAFAGLYYRAPWTSLAMVILMLSLAGLPITGGFFGKLYIMLGTILTHNYWLAAIMIITSVVSFYYYFGILRQMFMRTYGESQTVETSWTLLTTVWLCAGVTLLLGLFPQWVLVYLERIFSLTKDLFVL